MKLPQIPEFSKKILEESGKYLQDRQAVELANEYNERYLHWEEIKYRQTTPEPIIIWGLMKISRVLKAKYLKFGNWTFMYNVIDEFLEKLHILDKSAAGNLLSGFDTLQDNRKQYIISSLMEEAIASSQIEGAVTTRKIAKRMLQENRKPTNKSEKMIVNNYNTMRHIVNIQKESLTIDKILEVHNLITNGTLEKPEYEGNFRANNDIAVYSHDGTLLHQPVEYTEIPKLVAELCDFANNNEENFIHPVIKGVFIHFLIGFVHPFNDGNGRTARAMFYWYLLKNDYWLFEYMAVSRIINESKGKYRDAYLYSESDRANEDSGDLTYFIKYNLSCIEKARDQILVYLKRKQKEQFEALKVIAKSDNLNVRQSDILKHYLKEPDKLFTIKEVMTTYSVAYATARNDLFSLEKLGYVEKIKAGKKLIFILKNINNVNLNLNN